MTQDSRPRLTDRPALERHRQRGRTMPDSARFLHEDAIHDLHERLRDVNRSFTRPAIVTGHPEIWADVLPGAQIVPDDDMLALTPGSYDLVVHAMALHWADDPVGQLVQARHALVPDGLFLGFTLAGQTLAALRAALAQAEADLSGGLSPRVLPMGEIRDLGGLLQRAGLVMPVADLFTRTVSYRDALHLMQDLRAMGETNALAARSRQFMRRSVLLRAAELYHGLAGAPDGRVAAQFDLITLTGWSPGPEQPQPLRPGSAKMRLADALGSREQPLEDLTRAIPPARGPKD